MHALLAILAAAFLCVSCAPDKAAMDRALVESMAWIALSSDLDPAPLPNVVYFGAERLKSVVQPGVPPENQANIVAAYLTGSNTLLIPTTIDLEDKIQWSIVLHEMVHYMQDQSGDRNDWCPGLVEREAYDLQAIWLNQQGYDKPLTALGLNGMMYVILTSCSEGF